MVEIDFSTISNNIKIMNSLFTKLFADTKSSDKFDKSKKSRGWGDVLKIAGAATVMSLVPAVAKMISKKVVNKKVDRALLSRNQRLNRLSDNYAKSGLAANTDLASIEKYRKELDELYKETLVLHQNRVSKRRDEGEVVIQVNEDREGRFKNANQLRAPKDSILEQYINPFLILLRMILVRGVHIVAGTGLGADRHKFELIFDPDSINAEDAMRSPFKNVIYSHEWPHHGFETTTMGHREADELINDTFDFLASHPKFLTIRVR